MKTLLDKMMDLIPFVSCQEATRLISKRLDTRLTLRETIDLYLHLGVCDICQRVKKQFTALNALISNYQPLGEQKLPQDVKASLKVLLKQE